MHGNLKLVAKRPLASGPVEDDGASELKQQKWDFSRPVVKMLEPGEEGRLVAEYVVEDALPLSTVESPAFQKLVSKIPVRTSDKVKTNL